MEVFLVYLWLKVDSLLTLMFCVALSLFVLTSLFYSFGRMDCYYQDEKDDFIAEHWGNAKKAYKIGMVLLILSLMIPSSKQIAILVGTSYAVDFAKSPEGAKIGQLIRKKANDFLDEELKEIKPANKAGNPQ